MGLEKKTGGNVARWPSFKYSDAVLALIVAFFSLLALSRYFGIQLMEFDAVDKILFHGKAEAAEIVRIFSQPEGHVIYSIGYRPVSSLVWWIVFLFNGLNFSAFHALNFVLHALNSVLVFALARKLIKDKSGFFSFLAALVFAVHPVNLNVVLFVSRMPEMLTAFFLLGSLLSLIAFFEGKGKRFYFLSFFFCFAGVFSKESGALIPFVLFFYCLIFFQQKKFSTLLRNALRVCIPFFSLIVLYISLMFFSLGRVGGYIHSPVHLRSQIFLNFFRNLFYTVNFLSTAFFDELKSMGREPLADALLLIAFIACAFPLFRHFFKKKEDKQLLFLFCWMFIFLAAFELAAYMQIWYAYIPLMAVALLLSAELQRNFAKFNESIKTKVICALIALLFLSLIAFSSLFINYRLHLVASEITQTVLLQTVQASAALPAGSEIFSLNYPALVVFSEMGLSYSSILINDTSVQSLLDFHFPEKKFQAFSLSTSNVFAPDLDENQFSFSTEGDCVFLMRNRNNQKANISPSYKWKQGKENPPEITIERKQEEESQTIEITLPEQECERAFFFFFDGKKVQVIKASEGS